MARPRKDQASGDTEARIRAAGLAFFGRSGFEATSLADIAASVGVTRTTLLYYFESKERLYHAVVQEAFTQLASVLVTSMLTPGSLSGRVRGMVREFLAYVDARPHLAKLMVRELIDERGPGCEIIRGQGLPILRMVEEFLIKEGRLRPDQHSLLREILLQLTSSVLVRSGMGELRSTFWGNEAQSGELAAILLDALAAGAETSRRAPRPADPVSMTRAAD